MAGTSTKIPHSPYTMEGIAASNSVRNTRGCLSQAGHSSEMKTAMPNATGVARTSARIEEYSVPQMKGNAPNWPATGSHVWVRQKSSPNLVIDSIDSRVSTIAIPTTMISNVTAKAPVPTLKPTSVRRGPGVTPAPAPADTMRP